MALTQDGQHPTMLEQNHNFSDLDSIFSFIRNDLKRPIMNPPKSDDLLLDIRIDLELDEDLIVGNLSYFDNGKMPPQIQIDNALKLPELFSNYIARINQVKIANENIEYSKELIKFINDLNWLNRVVIKLFGFDKHSNVISNFMSPLQKFFQEKFVSINKSVFIKDNLAINQGIIKFHYLPQKESEFEVILEIYQNSYNIYCGGWHDYIEKDESEPDEEFVNQLIRKLEIVFSGSIKLRIYLAGKKPYRWEMISDKPENKISPLNITGLIFYNYFAKKTFVDKINICL